MASKKLYTELLDPKYGLLSDQAAADLINTSGTSDVDTSVADLLRYLFDNNLDTALSDSANEAPSAASTVATKILKHLGQQNMQTINLNSAVAKTGLAVLVAGSVLTQPQVDGIAALGKQKINDYLGIDEVSAQMVGQGRINQW